MATRQRELAPSQSRTENMAIRRKVLRPFEGAEGLKYKSGEVVDVTHWRNAAKLVDLRFLSDFIVYED